MADTLFATSFAPPAPSSITGTLSAGNVPLVLFPVRLETRFFQLSASTWELRVRVYPDRIHVDTHHPELSTDERTWGMAYWEQDWAAGADWDARADAWGTLASRFGPERAAWVARVLTPTNIALRATDPAPAFPTLPPVGEHGEDAWHLAPKARLLPDYWTAVLHSHGSVIASATGNPIPRDLNVGPDPAAPPPTADEDAAISAGDQLALDPGMMWMVDFDAAETNGMGLRLTVSQTQIDAGLDSLVVFGTATALTADDTAAALADLLDAHHYTDGLQFLRFGTPTNNTDDRRSGYTTDDPGHLRSFEHEVKADPQRAPNAERVGTALGLPFARIPATLGHVAGAADAHDIDQSSMNAALWQVSWGYYLSNMMGTETGLTTGNIDWARDHFTKHVRGGGAFPALRVGRQPYGILPVTSLDLWQPQTGENVAEDVWVTGLLHRIRESVWRQVLPNVARLGLRSGMSSDPDADLADVMRTDAISHGYLARPVFGRHFLEHLYLLSGDDFGPVAQAQDAVAQALLGALNLPVAPSQRPHVAHGFHGDTPLWVTAPMVQTGEISPWQLLELDAQTGKNYIGRMLSLTIDMLVAERPDPNATNRERSLLEMLLRHAMLREYASAAARIAARNGQGALATLLRDLELVDLVSLPPSNFVIPDPPKPVHWKRQLDLPAMEPGFPDGTTIRQYLETNTNFFKPEVLALGEFRTALDHLAGLDTETLQFLTQSTLDLASHRLDAWITSFASKRLAWMTNDGPIGVQVGAYGWVENLAPRDPMAQLPADAIPPGETEQGLYALPNDSGFIHAPSVAHASAAALLRNAHLGPTADPPKPPTEQSPFAIDLSSSRVREATRLLDGVRQGQPLSALLGYRLERHLHDLQLDPYIAKLRDLAPLAVREREQSTVTTEAVAANNVVDGLALLRLEQSDSAAVEDKLAEVPGSTQTERDLVKAEIEMLAESADALSDALVAEAAYQMARGNAPRLGNTLAAIAQGEALPSELEVVRTPRTGIAVTHRTVVMFSGAPSTPDGWTDASARTVGEAWLNAWIRNQLGDARTVRCTVEQLDASGAVVRTATFPLGQIAMSPLDLVYIVQPSGQSKGGSTSPSVAEQLVLYHARRRDGGFGADATLQLQHARPTDLAPGETTLFDVLEQARAVRRLLENARGLRPEDVGLPEASTLGTIDLVELEGRMTKYASRLSVAHSALDTLVANSAATPADDLRAAMLDLGSFGVGPFVPNIAVGDTPAVRSALAQQAAAMLVLSQQRIAQEAALAAQTPSTDERARCDQLIERARAVFGADFVVLPTFTLDPSGATELNRALAASTAVQGGDALAAHGWFTRSSRVRENLARLSACLRGAEVLASGTRLDLSVAQLPYVSGERWVGLPPLAGAQLLPGKLSLVVQPLAPIDAALPLSGVFVDEWVEIVPNTEETTALAFQYDPPNAFAPQNVLVAVPPVPGEEWTNETLRRVLLETLDLAKLRAVDPSLLGAAAQYLPALYIPFNERDDAVSTDFVPLTA